MSDNRSEDREEKKPVPSTEHVNLKVVGADNNEVFFKIKRGTALKKLMETYCERQGKSMATVRFLVDGERIQPTQSPEDLELEDGDTIEVMMYELPPFKDATRPTFAVASNILTS